MGTLCAGDASEIKNKGWATRHTLQRVGMGSCKMERGRSIASGAKARQFWTVTWA